MRNRVANDGFFVGNCFYRSKNIKGINEKIKKDKSIGRYSLFLAICYLELYWIFKEDIMGWIDTIQGISDNLRVLIMSVLGLLTTAGVYRLIYRIVYIIYLRIWAQKHSYKWINGDWLHIHIKGVIRIGYVNITQEFDNIYVNGLNTNPDQDKDDQTITKWKYEAGHITEIESKYSDKKECEYYGCYRAKRESPNNADYIVKKDGIHRMNIVMLDGKKIPREMKGYFGDTAKKTDKDGIDQHFGSLYFFRVSNKLKKQMKDLTENGILELIRSEYNNVNTEYEEIRSLQNIANTISTSY